MKPSILLIEDKSFDVDLTVQAINDLYFDASVQICRTGDEGLDYLYDLKHKFDMQKPQIILLDLNLPGTNGIEILTEINQDRFLKQIPVIVMSSSDNRVEINMCIRLGAQAYLTKPSGRDDYSKTIRTIQTLIKTHIKQPIPVI